MKTGKPLEGLTVVELMEGHGGTVTTSMFADFGAKVIKIELPQAPDYARSWAPFQQGQSAYFTYLNRGKDSFVLDYTSQEGQEILLRLLSKVDVFCENLPVGRLKEYHLDYDSVKEKNPHLIYASLTGFGQDGPLKEKNAQDLNIQALSGMMDRTGFPDGLPTPVGCRISDHVSAVYFSIGIQMALFHQLSAGKGQRVDVSQLDCLFSVMETGPWLYSLHGKTMGRTGNCYPSIAPYDSLKTKDGYISVGISTDKQWQKFCAVLELDEIGNNPNYKNNVSRGEHYLSELKGKIEAVFATMETDVIVEKLRSVCLACGKIQSVSEMMYCEQIKTREMLVRVEDKTLGSVEIPGVTVKLKGSEGSISGGASEFGEHTQKYLELLDLVSCEAE